MRRNPLLVLLTALIATIAPTALAEGPDWERKVSVTVVAAPLKDALKQLSQAAGYPLVALKAIENEVVSLRLKDATLREAMDRLAQAARAEWRPEQGQHRLTVGSELARKQASEETQAAVAEVRAALAALPGDGASPSGVVRAFEPSVLAAIQPNARVVFSTTPNRSQLAMPRAVATALDRWIAAARRNNAQPPMQGPPWVAPPDSPAVEGLVSVVDSPTQDGRILSFEISAFDAEGRSVVWGNQSVIVKSSLGATAASVQPVREFRMPSDAQFLANVLGEIPASAGPAGMPQVLMRGPAIGPAEMIAAPSLLRPEVRTKLPDEWLQRLSNPDTVEPHTYAAGAVLQAVAESADRNLAAWLTDRSFAKFGAVSKAKTPSDVLRVAAEAWGLGSVAEGSWLVLGPARPAMARRETLDRRVLGTALRLARSQGSLNLDQQAAVVRSLPNGGFPEGLDRALSNLLGIALPGPREWENLTSARSMLLFYGTLGQANLRALASGRAMPVGALGPSARSAVSTMVLSASSGLSLMGVPPPMAANSPAMREPTELLPLGVQPDALVELAVRQEPMAFGVDSNTGARVPLTQLELALLRNPALASGVRTRSYERFLLGTRSVLTFRFLVAPNAAFVRTLSEERPLPRGRELGLDELPPELFRLPPQVQVEVPAVDPVQGTERGE